MSETTREAVYTLRIEQGPALTNFEALTKRLTEARASRTALTKALKESQQVERDLANAVGLTGKAEDERQAALKRVKADIERQTKALADATLQEKFLSAQSRELGNDLAKLTEMGLRFRDKMADATLQALKQSGALEQMSVRTEVLQRDIANVNASLEKNQKTLVDLEVAYRKGEKTEQQYREEQAKLNAENEKLTASNDKLGKELGEVTGRLDKAEKQVEELNEAFRAGKISQDEYNAGLKRIDDNTKSLNDKFDGFIKGQGAELKSTLSGLALQYVGVGAAIYGVQQALGSAITIVKEFDNALGSVKALGGDYRARIDELGNAARAIGPKFGVGAAEAVGAIEALAKAGVSADDILRGGLEGALTLAASSSMEVAEAAELASGAMTQFGLAGQDVSHIADLLSAGASQALGEVSDLGMALKQSGLVASQAGLSLEETIGTLSAFASNVLIGSDAGTSFRTMLLRLENPSKEAAATMEELGIQTYDTNGQFVGMANLAGQLQQQLGALSDEQRNAALATIFGSDAVRAANVLYQQGAEGISEWTEKVDQSGFASQVATDKLDTLQGSMDRANAAWSAFVTGIDQGNGVLSRSVRGLIDTFSDFLGFFTEDALDLATQDFWKKEAANFEKAFGDAFKDAEFDTDALQAAMRQQTLQLQAWLKEDAEFVRNRVQDLAGEVSGILADANKNGGRLSAEQASRIAVLRTAQQELTAELQKRVEAEGKVIAAVADGNELAGQQIDNTNEHADSLAGLNVQLKELKTARESINLANQAELDANAAQIQGINQRIAALNAETKALSDKELQAARTKAEMDALAAQGPQLATPTTPGEVAQNGDLSQEDRLPAAAREIETNNVLSGALDERLAMYDAERTAYEELQNAKTDAVGGFASALGSLAKEGSIAAKSMFLLQKAVAVTDVITKTQAATAAAMAATAAVPPILPPGIPNPAYAVAKGIEIATIAKLRIAAAFSLATIGAQTLAGFAHGGDVSGDVRASWGPRIRRDNGDNVLVRAGGSYVTLKTGEKVLNEDQQREAERRFGRDIWGAIGVPGYAAGGKLTRGTALVNLRLSDEEIAIAQALRMGLIGYDASGNLPLGALATPRPSPSTLVNAELSTSLKAFAERPTIVDVREIINVTDRVANIARVSSSHA